MVVSAIVTGSAIVDSWVCGCVRLYPFGGDDGTSGACGGGGGGASLLALSPHYHIHVIGTHPIIECQWNLCASGLQVNQSDWNKMAG